MIELLIAALLMILIIGATAKFGTSVLRRNAAFHETEELDERRMIVSDLMRADYDAAGYNVVFPNPPGSGVESVNFEPLAPYALAPGQLTRIASSHSPPETAISKRALQSGTGTVSFSVTSTATRGFVGMSDADNAVTRAVYVDTTNPSNATWQIVESGVVVFSSVDSPTLGGHLTGDSYEIHLEPSNNVSSSLALQVAYYRVRNSTRTLLYLSPTSPPTVYPIAAIAGIVNGGGTLSNITITGAPLVDRTSQAPALAVLPMDGAARIASPIALSADGQSVSLYGGDTDTAPFYLVAPFDASSLAADGQAAVVSVALPTRGTIASGDFLLVADLAGNRSLLCVVQATSPTLLTLQRVSQSAAAWGRLWSDPTDAGYTFPAGSLLIKFAPPVTWTYTAADFALLRREGNAASTIADLGVNSFNVARTTATNGATTFLVNFVLASEGTESAANRADAAMQPVALTLSPRNLNRTYTR